MRRFWLFLGTMIVGLAAFGIYELEKFKYHPPWGTKGPLRWVTPTIVIQSPVMEGEPLKVPAVLFNPSRYLRKTSVRSSCGCINLTSDHRKPDENGHWNVYTANFPFVVEIDTFGRRGKQQFLLTAAGEPKYPGEPAHCLIEAVVVSYLVCNPPNLTMNESAASVSGSEAVVEVLAGAEEISSALDVRSPNGIVANFTAQSSQSRGFDGATMRLIGSLHVALKLGAKSPTGAAIEVECRRSKRKTLLNVSVLERPRAFEVAPQQVQFSNGSLPAKRVVIVRVESATPSDELIAHAPVGVNIQASRFGSKAWKIDLNVSASAFNINRKIVVPIKIKDRNLGGDVVLSAL